MTVLRVLQEVAHLKQTSSLEVLELDILSARPHHPMLVATTVVHVTAWQPILRPCKQRERHTYKLQIPRQVSHLTLEDMKGK